MAGPYRGQILLGTADAGWSETYYLPGASMTTAMAALQTINTDRMALARAEVKSNALRVVDVTAPRTSLLATPTSNVGTWTGADLSTIDPAIAILVRMTSADFETRSHHYLRGIPSAQMVGSATDPITWLFTAGYNTALNAWINQVIASAVLGIKTAPHTYTTKTISTMSVSTVGTIRRAGRPFELRRGRRLLV